MQRSTFRCARGATLCLVTLCYALAGGPAGGDVLAISEPFEMDTPVPGVGGGPFLEPSVAGNGDHFLVTYSSPVDAKRKSTGPPATSWKRRDLPFKRSETATTTRRA